MKQILLATRNSGKTNEIRSALSGIPIELIDLASIGIEDEIEETGISFAENARAKAAAYSRLSGMHSIADDSGLEVEVLNGRPGIRSARYAGASAKYDEKIAMLLKEIDEADTANRIARFVSHIALAEPGGGILFEAEGICNGTIAREPKGRNGFGYDPVFIPEGFDQTFGELADSVKQKIGHRALAISKIIRFLRVFA